MGDLSRNFDRSEFRCEHCGALRGPTTHLVEILQRARDMVGRPLDIVSGFRCPTRNRQVGGSSNSRHLIGGAADVPGAYASIAMWRAAGAHRIGVRGGRVIHVDDWPGYKGAVFRD